MATLRQQFVNFYGLKMYKNIHLKMRRVFKKQGIDLKGKALHMFANCVGGYFLPECYKVVDIGEHHKDLQRCRAISESHKGKSSPMKGKTLSEKTKKKLSEAFKGDKNPMYGKHHTEETKKKISEGVHKAKGGDKMYPVKHRMPPAEER